MADGPQGDDQDWGAGDAPAPTGAAYLSTLDPGRAAMVKAIGDGKMTLPKATTRGGAVSPQTQALISDVAQYNPQFDDADAPSRVAARKAFTSGKQGQNIASFNTALDHLNYLDQAVTGLGNVDSPIPGTTHLINAVRNSFRNADGSTAVSNFNASVPNVLDELVKAVRGTGGNEADINRLEQAFNTSQSPEQQRGVIQQWAQQLNGRINEIRNSYNTAIGTTGQDIPGISRDALAHLQTFLSPSYITNGAGTPPTGAVPGAGGPPNAPPPAGGAGGPPAPVDPFGGPATHQGQLATGASRNEFDPKRSAQLEDLIRNGGTMDQINAIAPGTDPAQVTAVRAYLKKHPTYSGFANVVVQKPNSILQNPVAQTIGAAVNGAGDAATFGLKNKLGAGASALAQRVGGDNRNLGDIYNDNLARAEIGSDALSAEHPIANLAGETAGFIGGDALIGSGLKAALGSSRIAAIPAAVRPALGDAIYGGAYGAGSSDSLSDVPGNVAEGAGLSALGGVLGRGVVKGTAAALSPVANAAVQRLTGAGVTLTPGQILGANGGALGSIAKKTEDRLAGFPLIGDVITNARRGGVEDFNRSAINDALSPIGESVDGVGHQAIGQAQQKVSDAYTAALSKMSATPDAQFSTDLQTVAQKAQGLSSDHRDALKNIIDTNVQPYLTGKTSLDGSDLQSIKQGLDKEISDYSAQNASPQDKKLADRLSDVRDAVLGLAARTDPAAASDFSKADQAYAKLSRVNAAAAKSNDGVFSPNQFRQAVSKRGYGTTTNNLASGNALMQGLSKDASAILPSSVPDSGTAGRAALGLIAGKLAGSAPGAALGGATGYANDGLNGALIGSAVGSALFSKTGLKSAQYLLAGSRGRTANTLGDILRRNSALGGAVGTPLLLNDLPK